MNANPNTVECEHYGTLYTEKEFEKLELTGHNRLWNIDYRRCKECGREITPVKTNIHGKIGGA